VLVIRQALRAKLPAVAETRGPAANMCAFLPYSCGSVREMHIVFLVLSFLILTLPGMGCGTSKVEDEPRVVGSGKVDTTPKPLVDPPPQPMPQKPQKLPKLSSLLTALLDSTYDASNPSTSNNNSHNVWSAFACSSAADFNFLFGLIASYAAPEPFEGKRVATVTAHLSPITSLVAFPDGCFATGDTTGMINIWYMCMHM
jgi:hypothetical protein